MKFFVIFFFLSFNILLADEIEYLRKGKVLGHYKSYGGLLLKSKEVHYQIVDDKLYRVYDSPYLFASEHNDRTGICTIFVYKKYSFFLINWFTKILRKFSDNGFYVLDTEGSKIVSFGQDKGKKIKKIDFNRITFRCERK